MGLPFLPFCLLTVAADLTVQAALQSTVQLNLPLLTFCDLLPTVSFNVAGGGGGGGGSTVPSPDAVQLSATEVLEPR